MKYFKYVRKIVSYRFADFIYYNVSILKSAMKESNELIEQFLPRKKILILL
jgi:hypothetical protein